MYRIIFLLMFLTVAALMGVSFLRSLIPVDASGLSSDFVYYGAPVVTVLSIIMAGSIVYRLLGFWGVRKGTHGRDS